MYVNAYTACNLILYYMLYNAVRFTGKVYTLYVVPPTGSIHVDLSCTKHNDLQLCVYVI